MPWPQSQDYNEAIQNQATSFGDAELRHGEVVTNASGLPLPRSGNFADVYEFRGASGQKWAIKCFTRQVPRLQERYGEISKYLAAANLPFTVDFTYLPKGIRVGSDFFPILKMKWVDGQLLNEVVRNQLDKPAWLEKLVQIWARMAERLHEAGIAHADLQHANVILVPGSRENAVALKLIDYDGMFIPTLKNVKSGESGHPAYQHPQRIKQDVYDAHVDRLPVLTVACAMRALAAGGKALWNKYDNGDNMLFREADLCSPASSPLFHELWRMDDPATHHLTGHLAAGVSSALNYVPLLSSLLHGDEVRPLSPSEKTRVEGILGVAKVTHRAVPVQTKKHSTPAPFPVSKRPDTSTSAPDWSALAQEGPILSPAVVRRRPRGSVLKWIAAAALVGAVAGGAAALTVLRERGPIAEAQPATIKDKSAPRLEPERTFDAPIKEPSQAELDIRKLDPENDNKVAKNTPEPNPVGGGGDHEDRPPAQKSAEEQKAPNVTPDIEESEHGEVAPGTPKIESKKDSISDPSRKKPPAVIDDTPAAPEPVRKPAPKESAIRVAKKEVRANFPEEFAKTGSEDRQALAARLLDEGRDLAGMNKDAYQYACLLEARELAVKEFDFYVAFEAVDELAHAFDVDSLKMKAAAIQDAYNPTTRKKDHNSSLAKAAMTVLDEIEDADAYRFLGNIPYIARDAASKSGDAALKAKGAQSQARLVKLKEEYGNIERLVVKLRDHPKDADANLQVGKFLVFQKEVWGKGLRLLALGSDEKLKAIAKMEIPLLDRMARAGLGDDDDTDESAAQLRLANSLWDYARALGREKKLVQAHAKLWYRRAEPFLEGADQEHAQQRLK